MVAALLVLAAAVVAAAVAIARPSDWRRVAASRRVIVSLRSGPSISGVLLRDRGALLVLADARLLEASSAPVPLDGEIVVERSNVAFVQVAASATEA